MKTYLILWKMTFQSNYMLLAPRNRLIQTLDILRCDGRPNCMNFTEQIVLVLDHTNASLRLSFDVQPNIFNNFELASSLLLCHFCERCTGALSSWNIYWSFGKCWAITGHKLSSRICWYFCALLLLWTAVIVPTPCHVMQPQIITAKHGFARRASTKSGLQPSPRFLQI